MEDVGFMTYPRPGTSLRLRLCLHLSSRPSLIITKKYLTHQSVKMIIAESSFKLPLHVRTMKHNSNAVRFLFCQHRCDTLRGRTTTNRLYLCSSCSLDVRSASQSIFCPSALLSNLIWRSVEERSFHVRSYIRPDPHRQSSATSSSVGWVIAVAGNSKTSPWRCSSFLCWYMKPVWVDWLVKLQYELWCHSI